MCQFFILFFYRGHCELLTEQVLFLAATIMCKYLQPRGGGGGGSQLTVVHYLHSTFKWIHQLMYTPHLQLVLVQWNRL